jgi:hypothetical protein
MLFGAIILQILDTRFRDGESSALCGDSGALVLTIWNAEWGCKKGGAKRFGGGCPAWRQRETGVLRQDLLPRADRTEVRGGEAAVLYTWTLAEL